MIIDRKVDIEMSLRQFMVPKWVVAQCHCHTYRTVHIAHTTTHLKAKSKLPIGLHYGHFYQIFGDECCQCRSLLLNTHKSFGHFAIAAAAVANAVALLIGIRMMQNKNRAKKLSLKFLRIETKTHLLQNTLLKQHVDQDIIDFDY